MATFDGLIDSAKVCKLVSPEAPRHFVQHSFRTIETKNLREAAAAFTFGREGLLPDVRQHVMASLCITTEIFKLAI